MARRRMFSKDVISTDKFMEMSLSAQALYLHLGVHADDDGFVSNPRTIIRSLGANQKDAEQLVAEGFILPFDSGVVVLTHWKQNNYLQKDRYTPTVHKVERSKLALENETYVLYTECIHDVSRLEAQVSIGKERKGKKEGEKKFSPAPSKKRFIEPTLEAVQQYVEEKHYSVDPETFIAFYDSNGWKVGRNKMKSRKSAIVTREKRENKPINNPKTIEDFSIIYTRIGKEAFTEKYGKEKAKEVRASRNSFNL